ncbi:chemotaxis protein CheW [Alteromonas sediminis]|uniref:Chemotaxis protein CheW n=1 Tax=Alteromonas sediminis TaxID=2259342 RepID=A0A3N5Y538_9ALTE|nr:chemotaxis protein CheW [Alteromonas sediminis]RPJ68333.1 chemotaxis protein CheW [Alteromonas sediminis]
MSESEELDELKEEEATSEWLSFALGESSYAVDILRVKEIRTWEKMARIPNSQPFILGLINLRGAIVPIIDLRLRFGLEQRERDRETVVLVMTVMTEDGEKTMGIMVDNICDAVKLTEDDIKSAEKFDLAIAERFVHGITDIRGAMAVLLNIDSVLDTIDF